ncbi:MAG: DegT/DnrJ/EryC1/StrS family aminotransferase [Gemmataceae bacterium]|nr:DegT/DnrJ/EryC1/StrS family aminotransferase [Gemmataceae bacterium]MCI0740865.1 DegT/DnrJ/EryC1/StrS family aminotransferase [Gemmataceae bacterium]
MQGSAGVPLCDVQAQNRDLEKPLREAVERVLRSGQVILGPEVEALEEEIAHYCGAGYGIGGSSGSDALLLALAARAIAPGNASSCVAVN